MSRHFEAIDLMKLYSMGSVNGWNEFLTECLSGNKILKLQDVQRRLQLGMAELAKKKLNTEEMINFYLRLDRSIDQTLAKIDKKLNPMLHDNPLVKSKDEKQIRAKRERDQRREEARKKNSY